MPVKWRTSTVWLSCSALLLLILQFINCSISLLTAELYNGQCLATVKSKSLRLKRSPIIVDSSLLTKSFVFCPLAHRLAFEYINSLTLTHDNDQQWPLVILTFLTFSSHFCVALLLHDKVDFCVTPKIPFWSEWLYTSSTCMEIQMLSSPGAADNDHCVQKERSQNVVSFNLFGIEIGPQLKSVNN